MSVTPRTRWEVIRLKKFILVGTALTLALSTPLMTMGNENKEQTVSVETEGQTEQKVQLNLTQAEEVEIDAQQVIEYLQRVYAQLRTLPDFDDEGDLQSYLNRAEEHLEQLEEWSSEQDEALSERIMAALQTHIENAIVLTLLIKEQYQDIEQTLEGLDKLLKEGEKILAGFADQDEEGRKDEDEQEGRDEEDEDLDQNGQHPKVVAHLDTELVSELRSQGFGYGEIALLTSISQLSEVELDELLELYQEQQGIGQVAKSLGLHPGKLIQRGKEALNLQEEESKEKENDSMKADQQSDEEKVNDSADEQTAVKGNGNKVEHKHKQETKADVKGNGKERAESKGQSKREQNVPDHVSERSQKKKQ
jgi:hypothetical protein